MEQKFCRSCGMNLTETAGSLAVQFGKVRDAKEAARERFFENLGKFGFGGLGAIVVIGFFFLIYTIITRFIVDGSSIAAGVFLILFLVFAALSLVYVIYNESRQDKKPYRATVSDEDVTPELPVPITGKFLNDPINEPIPSVVENTTELLKTTPKSRES